ncbi:septal ring lytic transglycosylase RlpA family protein [Alsobacter metallidurans]|uniref:septal ring lytic transglycosylase RlpA family protein n=1 Tax=Alsobacter metallidurans TaxID=340221 RepID=UPI001FCEB169|nr:septal ring lytic transglycosylase RlpA family protein [Alsobacter metallidurans]
MQRGLRVCAAVAAGLLVANCSSSSPTRTAKGGIDPKYGVSASPRVVADGEPVPKGGGRDLVGKPYVVAGRLYTPREMPNYSAVGTASWYGSAFHGRRTANGEVFDRMSISAAHPTMPLPSYIRVTNMDNGYSMIARVNDRGPYHGSRLIDVSQRVAESLRFKHIGTARVRVDYVGRASLAGSDDQKLAMTLRSDGLPAQLRGADTMVASAEPAVLPRPSVARALPADDEEEGVPAIVAKASPAPAVAAPRTAPVSTPIQAVAALPLGKPAPGVPLPPDRPFDLGTIPNAAKPVPAPAPRTAQRAPGTVTAGLFYAQPDAVTSSFRKDDPMARLIQQNFVPLRAAASF